jgi:hypothetical protein
MKPEQRKDDDLSKHRNAVTNRNIGHHLHKRHQTRLHMTSSCGLRSMMTVAAVQWAGRGGGNQNLPLKSHRTLKSDMAR